MRKCCFRLFVFYKYINNYIKIELEAPMNTVDKIVESFQVLKTSIEDDIAIYELLVKMNSDYANTLCKSIERLISKNNASSGLLIHTSLDFIREEANHSEVICTFLRNNPLVSFRALHEKMRDDLRKFQEGLKEFYDQDTALCKKAHKETHAGAENSSDGTTSMGERLGTLSIEKQRSELILQNMPTLKLNIDMAVKSINECVLALENEHKRLHLFVSKLLKNQQPRFEYPSLVLENWENINFQRFRSILEDETKTESWCNPEAQCILKEDVRVKEGWRGWKDGILILYPNCIIVAEDKNAAKGSLREYMLDTTDVLPIGSITLKLAAKSQGIISYLLGLDMTTIELSSQDSRNRVVEHLKSNCNVNIPPE